MTAATLDLPVLADGQLDSDQAPLQQLADAVAALWSAGTGLALQPAAVALEDAHARVVLAEPWSRAEEAPEQAVFSRLDRPFGRRACDLVALLEVPQAQGGVAAESTCCQNGRCYTSRSTFWRICWISSWVVYSPGRGGGAFHGEAV